MEQTFIPQTDINYEKTQYKGIMDMSTVNKDVRYIHSTRAQSGGLNSLSIGEKYEFDITEDTSSMTDLMNTSLIFDVLFRTSTGGHLTKSCPTWDCLIQRINTLEIKDKVTGVILCSYINNEFMHSYNSWLVRHYNEQHFINKLGLKIGIIPPITPPTPEYESGLPNAQTQRQTLVEDYMNFVAGSENTVYEMGLPFYILFGIFNDNPLMLNQSSYTLTLTLNNKSVVPSFSDAGGAEVGTMLITGARIRCEKYIPTERQGKIFEQKRIQGASDFMDMVESNVKSYVMDHSSGNYNVVYNDVQNLHSIMIYQATTENDYVTYDADPTHIYKTGWFIGNGGATAAKTRSDHVSTVAGAVLPIDNIHIRYGSIVYPSDKTITTTKTITVGGVERTTFDPMPIYNEYFKVCPNKEHMIALNNFKRDMPFIYISPFELNNGVHLHGNNRLSIHWSWKKGAVNEKIIIIINTYKRIMKTGAMTYIFENK